MHLEKVSAYRSGDFFAAIFQNNPPQQLVTKYEGLHAANTAVISNNASHQRFKKLHLAQHRVIDGFRDLQTVLESFYEIYSNESDSDSQHYRDPQLKAIKLAKSLGSQREDKGTKPAFDMLQHHNAHHLFNLLKELKKHQSHLPNGWYQSIKQVVRTINQANKHYQQVRVKLKV